MIRLAFLICLAFYVLQVNSGVRRRSFRVQEVFYLSEVEPAPEQVIPDGSRGPKRFRNVFSEDRENSSANVGWLFAGRTEFNWLVQVSARSLGSKSVVYKAIGNLFSTYHVLTTCSFLVSPDKKLVDFGLLRIQYATLYLKDAHKYYYEAHSLRNKITGQQPPESGTRGSRVNGIYIHPDCYGENYHVDAVIITMNRAIIPWSPIITFMPSYVDITAQKNAPSIELADLQRAALFLKNLKCYVASYGKPYLNWDKNYVQQYKVKYRAYPQDWAYCNNKFREYICSRRDDPRKCKVLQGESRNSHMCFTTRARTGSVCYNYDRGAPLVCNGLVYGIVTNAAKQEYCSSRIQLPFIVMKMTAVTGFMKKALQKDITLLKRAEYERHLAVNKSSSYQFIFPNHLISELCFIFALGCIFYY